MRKNGFTLLEILVVIVVIGILATLVAGAAIFAVRSARDKRVKISCAVLQTAIYRYRAEYNEWPGGYHDSWGGEHIFLDDDNKDVFSMLRVDSDDNPDHIRFIDETAFFTPDDAEATKLSETTGTKPKPLVFVAKDGRWTWKKTGKHLYYRVIINYKSETVTVDTKKTMKDRWDDNKKKDIDIFAVEDEDEFWERYEEVD